ncbi:MAG: hypothetical protein AB3N14_15440 [Flavobacteriaceae bacterium]
MKDTINFIIGPQGLILLGGILALVGAFWSARRDLDSEKELNAKNQIIIEKSDEITELNNQIKNVLTGGNSFPYVIFGSPDDIHGLPTIHLKGENAIANVTGKLIDIRALRLDQRKGNIPSDVGINFSKDIISPAYATFVINENSFYDISKGARFLVHFYTPYYKFTQVIAVEPRTTDMYPLQAYRIYKGGTGVSDGNLIYTNYPDNFPIPLEEIDFLEDLTSEELQKIKKKNKT